MINTNVFAKDLFNVTGFFAGVPDSLLKDLCAAIEQVVPEGAFQTAANEGAAVALAAGYTLASGKPGCVYMQNSGLGNAINPLLSLNDPLVYGIPVLLLIGWRGQPGIKDEPQHKKQGLITEEMLEVCGIPYQILSNEQEDAEKSLSWAVQTMRKTTGPVALLIPKGLFCTVPVKCENSSYSIKRESAIEAILCSVEGKDVCIVSTTGMISRELYDLRERRGENHGRDFLTVGSMGHASQIALGIAMYKPDITVICLDGDGAALMHMGGMAVIGTSSVQNLIHIVLNNEAHDSVGGHATCAGAIDWSALAVSCGYTSAHVVREETALSAVLEESFLHTGKCFIEIKVSKGARSDLGRPIQTPIQCKEAFSGYLSNR